MMLLGTLSFVWLIFPLSATAPQPRKLHCPKAVVRDLTQKSRSGELRQWKGGAKQMPYGEIWGLDDANAIRAWIFGSDEFDRMTAGGRLIKKQGELMIWFFRRSDRFPKGFEIKNSAIHGLDFDELSDPLGELPTRELRRFVETMTTSFRDSGGVECDKVVVAIRAENGGGFFEGHSHGPSSFSFTKAEIGMGTEYRIDGEYGHEAPQAIHRVPRGSVLLLRDAWHRTPFGSAPRLIVVGDFVSAKFESH